METESQLSNRTLPLKVGDYVLSQGLNGIVKITGILQSDDNDDFVYSGTFNESQNYANVREDAFSDKDKFFLFKIQGELVQYYRTPSLDNRVHEDLANVPEQVLDIIFDWTDKYTIIDEDTYLLHLGA